MSRKRKGPKLRAKVEHAPDPFGAEYTPDHAHPPQAGASFLRPVSETTGRYETEPAPNTMVSNDRGLASLGVPSTPCVLCGGPVVGMGHNAQPVAEGRCCDACNTSAVIPARLIDVGGYAWPDAGTPSPQPRDQPTPGQQLASAPWSAPRIAEAEAVADPVSPGQRLAARAAAHQADLPGAAHPGAEMVPDVPEERPAADDVIRWTPALGPGRITHAAAVPEFRAWLIRQWQPGGSFHRAAKAMADTPRGRMLGKTNLEALATDADVERRTLQRAALYYVEPPMVALLASCAPSCPPDVRPVDLVSAADDGLVVLAEPVAGTAADTGSPVETWAFTWSRCVLRASTLPGEAGHLARYGERIPCLSVGTYRLVDFDQGLRGSELNAAALLAAGAAGLAGTDGLPANTPVAISGTVWTPMGRSDWPIEDALAAEVPWALDEAMATSIREDRALIAAMFTLLAEDHVAAQMATSAPRAAVRRLTRAGITAPDAARVVVVNLRRPKVTPSEPDPDAPHMPHVHTHSWLVREHLRWQPVGPGRKERRLTVVRAHTKGTGPLVLKQKVQRWVR
jgi:hypothetical protein